MKESGVQRQILDYLALNGIFHYRNNSGAFVDSQKHFYRFGALGGPDIICVIKGQYVGIEVKAPKGKRSDHQKEFQKKLEEAWRSVHPGLFARRGDGDHLGISQRFDSRL